MVKKLVVEFFKKIEENESITSKHGKSRFLIRELLEKKYDNFGYDIQKATRLQKKYVENDLTASAVADPFLKNVMATYLGYDTYNDFVAKSQPIEKKPVENAITESSNSKEIHLTQKLDDDFLIENQPTKNTLPENTITKNAKFKKLDAPIPELPPIKPVYAKFIMIIISIIFVACISYKYYPIKKSDCIVWTGYVYKKTECDTYKSINNTIFNINIESFKRINVNEDTWFYKNGKAIVWYGKNLQGKIEYFNSRGIHPETDKELHLITRHFLNKHGLLNE